MRAVFLHMTCSFCKKITLRRLHFREIARQCLSAYTFQCETVGTFIYDIYEFRTQSTRIQFLLVL